MDDTAKKIMDEFHSQQLKRPKHETVKLPCCNASVEVDWQDHKPTDQILVCPSCFKRSLIVYQLKPKLVHE